MLMRRARENRLAVEAKRLRNGEPAPNKAPVQPTTIAYRDHELILRDQRLAFEQQLEEARKGGSGDPELGERLAKAEAEAAELREKLGAATASVEDLTAKLAKAKTDLDDADADIAELEKENAGLRQRLEAAPPAPEEPGPSEVEPQEAPKGEAAGDGDSGQSSAKKKSGAKK